MILFKKIKRYKYTIHLGESDYKSVITLNGEQSQNDINWSYNLSPDLEKDTILSFSYHNSMMELLSSKDMIKELEEGRVNLGPFIGDCKVKKHNV